MVRAEFEGLWILLIVLVLAAVIWGAAIWVSNHPTRPSTRRASGAWLIDQLTRLRKQHEAEEMDRKMASAPWEAFCHLLDGNWEIGIHKKVPGLPPFDRQVLHTLPADGDLMVRVDKMGEAEAAATDLNVRRAGA